MAQLATFVFTDLVGSVEWKRRMPGAEAAERDAAYVERILRPHRERIERGLVEAGGRVVSTAGDGHFLVFANTGRAALWAVEMARAHGRDAWGEAGGPRVRIGIHAGEPQPDPSDPDNFVGRAVDYAARLADHAQGGQVLVSRTTASLIEDAGLEGVTLHGHGTHSLRGIGEVEMFELVYPGHPPVPPRRTAEAPAERSWSVLPRTMGLTEYGALSGGRVGSRGAESRGATAVAPRRVGNYQLGELLGSGGMGRVYKARHAQFDRPRAVKLIRPELVESGGESVVRRFYQEVRATGSLEHPNLVVAIDSSSPEDDEHYLVMEFIDGVSAEALVRDGGPLPAADACEVARQAALGLAHLDSRGLVHRDVKPSNLMVTLAGEPRAAVVKLMDLGLALLGPGSLDERVTRFDRGGMGTGQYMSPEQWRTTSVDIRADVYSLGCTLYHLLMGEPPFAASDLRPDRAHATAPPPRLSPATGAPRELVALVARMLAKDPRDRPQTPGEVAAALESLATGNRLAERVARVRAASLAGSRDETDGSPAPASETTGGSPRRLVGPAPAPPRGPRWLLTALATALAVGGVLVAYGLRTAMLQQRRADLQRTASFAAADVAGAIEARLNRLSDLADQPKLREWLAAIEAAGGYESESPPVVELQRWLLEQKAAADKRFASDSWFVTDARGVQLARSPAERSIGESFSHRDYFHGRGPEHAADPDAPTPIAEVHQSDVYRSSTSRDLKVAFSVPVFSDGPKVVGVLAMSVVLGDFRELEKADRRAADVEILLADTGVDMVEKAPQRGLVLHHRDLRAGARLPAELLAEVERVGSVDRAAMLAPYEDVLGRGSQRYWGAVSRVAPEDLPDARSGTWVVIAQEPAP